MIAVTWTDTHNSVENKTIGGLTAVTVTRTHVARWSNTATQEDQDGARRFAEREENGRYWIIDDAEPDPLDRARQLAAGTLAP